MDLNILKQELRSDEGFKSHAYKDHLGYWTIGVGRLIDEQKGGGITEEEGNMLLSNDIARVISELDKKLPLFKRLSEVRQRAIINMAFQLGVNGLLNFKKMITALDIGHYDRAYLEAMDSKWARIDTPERAKRVATMIKEG